VPDDLPIASMFTYDSIIRHSETHVDTWCFRECWEYNILTTRERVRTDRSGPPGVVWESAELSRRVRKAVQRLYIGEGMTNSLLFISKFR
jgi:hypothetical protein